MKEVSLIAALAEKYPDLLTAECDNPASAYGVRDSYGDHTGVHQRHSWEERPHDAGRHWPLCDWCDGTGRRPKTLEELLEALPAGSSVFRGHADDQPDIAEYLAWGPMVMGKVRLVVNDRDPRFAVARLLVEWEKQCGR